MDLPVILSKLEQEYLLGAIEAALPIDHPRRLFLWAQGQLQAVLPHQALVCLQLDGDGQVCEVQCAYGAVLARGALEQLAGADGGLAGQLARLWRGGPARPAILESDPSSDGPASQRLAPLRPALQAARLHTTDDKLFANVLVHGSGALPGGATFFALFGMPFRPGPRHAYFLELLLPHLHLALLRMVVAGATTAADAVVMPVSAAPRPVSRREMEILQWVREGKNNEEIGRILGISGWTVKNHLQRIYKTMGVSNRAQAVARAIALRLLAPADNPLLH
ncbi:MAG: LuxR C-terminal-related transcriptional regulator [Burkholderiaceae bacterium]|nr:LuxR C-terminal-related transcriptional regulator [Burkholderiaceae bacterium]